MNRTRLRLLRLLFGIGGGMVGIILAQTFLVKPHPSDTENMQQGCTLLLVGLPAGAIVGSQVIAPLVDRLLTKR